MLVQIVTIILVLGAVWGWLFLKRNSERYLRREDASINFFFRWGWLYHHLFKVTIIILSMLIIFSFYKYLLNVSNVFALTAALIAGIILSGGKELLDKGISPDDIFTSILGIMLGFFVILLFF